MQKEVKVNKLFLIILIVFSVFTTTAQTIKSRIRIVNEHNQPVVGANIKIGSLTYNTNGSGVFMFQLEKGTYQMAISHQGYQPFSVQLSIPITNDTLFKLTSRTQQLEEVMVSTGYYQQNPEKTTGSFLQLKGAELERNGSASVVQRLEGIVPSLSFDRRVQQEPSDKVKIILRGASTINGEQDPLIVLDNFPFYGDINLINPDHIESITVLKDAAAASIWGAKAGNGVIVITTKQARTNQPTKISFNALAQVKPKPNLLASNQYISSADFLNIEEQLFANNYYLAAEQSTSKTALSPFVEKLIAHRDGLISSQALQQAKAKYANIDVRKEAMDYLYTSAMAQRYNLNLSNGSEKSAWLIGLGYDKDHQQLIKNKSDRLGLNMNLKLQPLSGLTIALSSNFTLANSQSHDVNFSNIGTLTGRKPFPYTQLRDEDGNNLAITRLYSERYKAQMIGVVPENWDYVPLDEIANRLSKTLNSNVRLLGNINYQLFKSLSLDIKYQFQEDRLEFRNLKDATSIEVRNYINQYTQANGVSVFPGGGILHEENNKTNANNLRLQINYNKSFKNHQIIALAGYERNSLITKMNGLERYGYDDNSLTYTIRPELNIRYPTYPTGNLQLPLPNNELGHLIDNYLSYFSNISYTFKNKYIITGSGRIDASNLFGVSFNQKSVPLWSAGTAWLISEESFWKSKAIPKLKLQATYGYSGNVDKSVTAYTTASYDTNTLTGLRFAKITSPANKNLKWEQVGIGNMSLTAEGPNNKWRLKVEYFDKKSKDLIGEIPVDPTVGIISGLAATYRLNYAQLATNGFELEMNFNAIAHKNFKWNMILNAATNRTKVVKYDHLVDGYLGGVTSGLTSSITIGKPLDAIFGIPWFGLDESGNPKVLINNLPVTYNEYVAQLKRNQLVYHGAALPTLSGNFISTFSFQRFQLSVQVLFKGGYYFRKKTIDYTSLFSNLVVHQDFNKRWQKPGDELLTHIPSMPLANNANRDLVYVNSEVNVLKGDHIRLKDINLSYQISNTNKQFSTRFFANIDNVGLVWVANKEGLDPDYPSTLYPNLTTYSIGLKLNF